MKENRQGRTAIIVLLLCVVSRPAAIARLQVERAATFEDVRQEIERGQYARAERDAEALVSSTASGGLLKDRLMATDLLVEARVQNGRGQERNTRDLAETVVNE